MVITKLKKIWEGRRIKNLDITIQTNAKKKLRQLNNAQTIFDLQTPPSNHLEKLKGTLKAYHSIRINRQYRLIFIWDEKTNNASEVYIDDYH